MKLKLSNRAAEVVTADNELAIELLMFFNGKGIASEITTISEKKARELGGVEKAPRRKTGRRIPKPKWTYDEIKVVLQNLKEDHQYLMHMPALNRHTPRAIYNMIYNLRKPDRLNPTIMGYVNRFVKESEHPINF